MTATLVIEYHDGTVRTKTFEPNETGCSATSMAVHHAKDNYSEREEVLYWMVLDENGVDVYSGC